MNKVMTGCVIGVKRELFERYCQLHDQQPQEIRDLLKQYGFTKLAIVAGELPDGNLYLVQYNEVEEGADQSGLYADPRYQQWLKDTGLCQAPLPGETFWKNMDHVYEL